MKKILLETSFSKIYIIVMILISVLVIGGYFSYAMFTVTKEKSNAISIITGNLNVKVTINGQEVIATADKPFVYNYTISQRTSEYYIDVENLNNMPVRINCYYLYEGGLPAGNTIGYVSEDYSIPPDSKGKILNSVGTMGSKESYRIKLKADNITKIGFGLNVGLDYNELQLPENAYTFEEYPMSVSDVILDGVKESEKYNDGVDTFITGEDPNNYIWYSGKLWRAVSVNNSAKTTKLVTQWNISAIRYSSGDKNFEGSYMKDWLNDTTIDGFLGNLREPEKFIVMDAKWDATIDNRTLGSITRPNGTSVVTVPVGLLNIYEFQSSYHGTTSDKSYLKNRLNWYTLTPYNLSVIRSIHSNASPAEDNGLSIYDLGVRPSINLRSDVKIVDGNGTKDNPYRLKGDNDTNLSGTLLNTRYSGEYIKFGTGENNLYRIVSHENGTGTKITSAGPLKDSGTFKEMNFGSNSTFTITNTIGSFLNNSYLSNYVGSSYIDMIEENSIWYLGTVGDGASYKLAKYKDYNMSGYAPSINAKVGLLRHGELMAGQFDTYSNNWDYWFLTPYNASYAGNVNNHSTANGHSSSSYLSGVRPSLNLKSNVIITGGTGLKNDPFTIAIQ